MSKTSLACFTLEAALQNAIEMENRIFADFQGAIQTVKSKAAKELLREAALSKLVDKHRLEKALIQGTVDEEALHSPVPTMSLDVHYGKKALAVDSDTRESLAFAIHLVTLTVNYYKDMAQACGEAPMSRVFMQISGDQTSLLQKLEDSYEEHFLTEN